MEVEAPDAGSGGFPHLPFDVVGPGELLGGIVPLAKAAELTVDFESFKRAGFLLGHGSILAIVGDGHVSGIVSALSGSEVETVRLRDLRTQPSGAPSGQQFTTSFWIKQG